MTAVTGEDLVDEDDNVLGGAATVGLSGGAGSGDNGSVSGQVNSGREATEVSLQEEERWAAAMSTLKASVTPLVRDVLFRYMPMFGAAKEKKYWAFNVHNRKTVCYKVLDNLGVLQWSDSQKMEDFWNKQKKVIKAVWNNRRNNVNGMIKAFLVSKYSRADICWCFFFIFFQ
jgi:hypothetical protein